MTSAPVSSQIQRRLPGTSAGALKASLTSPARGDADAGSREARSVHGAGRDASVEFVPLQVTGTASESSCLVKPAQVSWACV